MAVLELFPVVARHCGRGPLDPTGAPGARPAAAGWAAPDAARVVLLAALPPAPGLLPGLLTRLYRAGGTPERRALLRALPVLDPLRSDLGDAAVGLVHEALRSQDNSLVAAALSPYAARHLDAAAYRHAVLKCVFMGVPPVIAEERVDAELARMLADHAHERVAAGRDVPEDVWPVLARFPAVVAASGLPGEADRPEPGRRAAARRALTRLAAHTPAGVPGHRLRPCE
nr:EboA domain-containing protein [Streptomyces sp. SID12488]